MDPHGMRRAWAVGHLSGARVPEVAGQRESEYTSGSRLILETYTDHPCTTGAYIPLSVSFRIGLP